ncbi:ATP-sensitive inward rectifier potassium channel 1 [Amia ocellicauda]|uniref:ATP-sensitive inward rectifier potassium channel 1 n=1 Tax=Amia ocellicauda TaxID=2972642 RepID=UPI003464B1AA|nr:KCNJ1 protein [Amia calva]
MFQFFQKHTLKHQEESQIRRARLVSKDGHCNIEYSNMKYHKHLAFLMDFWTTCVELRWRYVLFFFGGSILLSWFIFGLLYYVVAMNNGDLLMQNPSSDHIPCILNINTLNDAYLFSLETQMTVGYGYRLPMDTCATGISLFTFHCIVTPLLMSMICGVIVAKILMPKKRAKTVSFSQTAVISKQGDKLCLLLRLANLRKTLLIGSQIYGKLFRTSVTPEGETVILDQVNIDFMVDAGKDNLFFVCPLTLCHIIDKSSPFFEMSVDTLHKQDFELVVFLDSTTESTSSSCQVRTSFIQSEIQWGYTFLPIISRSKEGKYRVDFSNFNKTKQVTTPHCAYCFYNEDAHLPQEIKGRENQGFEGIETNDSTDITNVKPRIQRKGLK